MSELKVYHCNERHNEYTELHAALGAVINGNPKAKNIDCFVSIDFGDGKKISHI